MITQYNLKFYAGFLYSIFFYIILARVAIYLFYTFQEFDSYNSVGSREQLFYVNL